MKKLSWIKLSIVLLTLIFVGLGFYYYRTNISATKVAFVNFRDYQISRINKSNSNPRIKIEKLGLDALDKASNYKVVFIFGRGLHLSPEQIETLQNAEYNGVKLFVQSATNPNMDITNLQGEELDKISNYFKYGGTENYDNLLAYIRKEMDGKTWFITEPADPKLIPRDVFIHLKEDEIFNNYQDYSKFLVDAGLYKAHKPKIALLTSVPGPFNSNREHIDDFIKMLEKRDFNVYTISARTKRLDFLKQTDPDLVILMPHGRFASGQSDEAITWLKQKNIPLLAPLSIFQPYNEWIEDPQGFAGPLLSMSVVLPEIDGGINPYAIIAQYKDNAGYLSFQTIPDRLEKFGDMVEKWVSLKQKPNKDKKIAIYYFKGPGLNAMTAANMEVVPSLYNLLKHLKSQGYSVDNLPNSPDELWKMILKQGAVLGPYAKGAFDDFLENGNPELVNVSDYKAWVQKDLKASSYQTIVDKYGEAPGAYLATTNNGKDYLAVSRLQFGNVVLLPQPLPGVGDDTYKLVHGAKTAPPHPYVASYLWTRNAFHADAIFHLGTHGSLEFTPGKQVALSGYDWADALIGVTPHLYIYTISNVGEGIIAKRRSYATTLTYLTPPFMEADVYGELKQLQDKLTTFTGTKGIIREQYRKTITVLACKLKLHTDLGLDSTTIFDDMALFKLSNYIEEISNSKVTGGLYTLGVNYNQQQANNTARLMAVDPIAYSLAALDKLKGKTSPKQLENKMFFDKNYRQVAEKAITSILDKGLSEKQVLFPLLNKTDIEKTEDWLKQTKGIPETKMAKTIHSSKNNTKIQSHTLKEEESKDPSLVEIDNIKRLVIAISPFPERKEFILKLKSDKHFKQSSSLLNPKTLEHAKKLAKAIPAMAKAIKIGQQPDVLELLKLMQKKTLRPLTFKLMEDESLAKQIADEKEKIEKRLLTELTNDNYLKTISLVEHKVKMSSLSIQELQKLSENLNNLKSNWEFLKSKEPEKLSTYLSMGDFQQKMNATIENAQIQIAHIEKEEANHANAVLRIKQTLHNVSLYEKNLISSTDKELKAVQNGLIGGYIAPSSGGDPITNPSTIPTGRNLYSIDAEKTPSPEAWNIGKKLGNTLLESHFEKHGSYPKKVSFTLWSGDFIETEGAMIAQIFYLLGIEPVWGPFGRVMDIKCIPIEQLKRPRIDVLVQTSGQLRDLAASRLYLINKAVRLAAKANDTLDNFVKDGVLAAEVYMKKQGLSPMQARELATQRVFGGLNGNYGTNIMSLVERGDIWENEQQIAETYINNMGAMYDEGDNWGAFQKDVFEAALQNTEVVIQPRRSNTWGGLSLDHVYEFMGGLSLAVRHVTGKDPDAYFNDFRNPSNVKIQTLKEALWVEARTTLLNPKYIKEYMKGGATSAETFAETFRNTYGWNVMKPKEIDDALWNQLYDVYIKDTLELNVQEFFKDKNPYALEEMTAVMLETARKGYWKASKKQIQELSRLHVQLIKAYKAGCSEFVCNNGKLQHFISNNVPEALNREYSKAIKAVRESKKLDKSLVLEKEEKQPESAKNKTREQLKSTFVFYTLSGAIIILLIIFIIKRRKES